MEENSSAHRIRFNIGKRLPVTPVQLARSAVKITLRQQIQMLNMLQPQLIRNFLEGETRISDE